MDGQRLRRDLGGRRKPPNVSQVKPYLVTNSVAGQVAGRRRGWLGVAPIGLEHGLFLLTAHFSVPSPQSLRGPTFAATRLCYWRRP